MHAMQIRILCAATMLSCAVSLAGTRTNDEQTIRDAYAAESHAYTIRDLEGTLTPYAKDVIVFDIIPPMQHAGIETNRQTNQVLWEKSQGPITVAFSNLKVSVDHDHAYASYFLHVMASLKDGRSINLHARSLDVWERRQGHWLIVM